MLLTSNTQQMIRETILQIDPDAKVFLFGSRKDDMAKGGDINLLILSIIFTTRDLRKLKSTLRIDWEGKRLISFYPLQNLQPLLLKVLMKMGFSCEKGDII